MKMTKQRVHEYWDDLIQRTDGSVQKDVKGLLMIRSDPRKGTVYVLNYEWPGSGALNGGNGARRVICYLNGMMRAMGILPGGHLAMTLDDAAGRIGLQEADFWHQKGVYRAQILMERAEQ